MEVKVAEILEALKTFFTNDEWPFNEIEGKPSLRTGYRGKNGNWNCYAQAREEQHIIMFYSVCPINAPEDKRQLVAEYISRANYGQLIGNFEMDFTDGEIRYKTSLDVENAELTSALIHNLVYANVWSMDNYLPGIMSVVYAGVSPQEAIKKIEG
jgi:hypothetical protein